MVAMPDTLRLAELMAALSLAGGHIRGTLGLLPLVSRVLDRVRVPVLAGGASAASAPWRPSSRRVQPACAAARGSWWMRSRAPTPFMWTEDAVRTDLYHVGCVLCPSTHRVLSSAIEAAQKLDRDLAGEFEFAGQKMPIARFQGVPTPVKGMSGHVEAMCCCAGQSAGGCAWSPAGSRDRH